MRVSEIFHSLNGEGPMIGVPSVFIRLGGCIEPYCPWCDTAYAWNQYTEMTPREIIEHMTRYGCSSVVITGGEPFLQWESGLMEVHRELVGKGMGISYETSGKAGIPDLPDATIVLSPKHFEGTWHLNPEDLRRADFCKFVAQDLASLSHIDSFIHKNAIPKEKVYIMPMGATRKEQLERMETVFTFCRDHGYRMSLRLHTLIFDNTRGI
jgi:7-carboxy-7-deazaguanine synthase